MGSRTVSASPKETVRYAREFLSGLGDNKILGCGKHFPGLGGANLDSHHALPSIDKTWKRLWSEDLVPYCVMRREFPMIMVAHVSYPSVQRNGTPASLSRKWITQILRKKIGYRGLVISDDLDMGGVLNTVSIEDAAVETLRAGSDLFLVCQEEEHVWRAYEAVFRRAERDRPFARLIALKTARVASFKARSPELRARMAPAPSPAKVDALRRRVWEFTEELRMGSIVAPEDRAL
jgi:beta-N-acetylhexosaminidase